MNYIPHIKQPKSWEELKNLMPDIADCDPRELRLAEDELFYELYGELVPKEIKLEILTRIIGDKPVALVKNHFPLLHSPSQQ